MPWPKGKPRSLESRRKTSESLKGHHGWNKGRLVSEETRLRQSKSQTGRKHPDEVKQKIALSRIGKARSNETRIKLSLSRKGIAPWNKGIPLSEDTKRKLSIANSGENAPNWQGGISFEPYCPKFNISFKEQIRTRFDRKCYLCDISEHENGKRLGIHHIDYNKNSICNGKDWAFVPLCKSCHSKTNMNRWHWFNLLINYWALNPNLTI